MEIPEKFRGGLNGAFFRRNDGTYTFIGFEKEKFEGEGRFREELGYKLIKKVSGVNYQFYCAAISFAEKNWTEKMNIKAENINLEEIIKFADKNELHSG